LGDSFLPSGFRVGQEIDIEVGSIPYGDYRTDHYDPDEAEASHFFGLYVSRNDAGVSRNDLQSDGKDYQPHKSSNRDLQKSTVSIKQ